MRKERTRNMVNTLIAIVIAMIFLFPIYWIFISSLKSDAEIFANAQTWWPREMHLENYVNQFQNKTGTANIMTQFKNSWIIALCSMVLSLVLSIPASYGLSRFRLPGKKVMLMMFLVTQMLPASLISVSYTHLTLPTKA